MNAEVESTGPHFLHLLGRHQLASFLATMADYVVMIFAVSVMHLGPVRGTIIGASVGALSNFLLNRHFTFKATHARPTGQLLRYVLVSGASLALNAVGMHFLANHIRIQYIVARLGIGTAVGVLWNFPMHRYFVFRRP